MTTNTQKEESKPKEETVYKYSNKGQGQLREAAIIEGKAYFIKYYCDEEKNKHFVQVEPKISEISPILRPPFREEYPYNPYEFKTVDEPQKYLLAAMKETPDSLLAKIKTWVKSLNDLDDKIATLLSGNIFGSYFQDRFSTVHYIIVVGANGTGKSVLGDTFKCLGYRAVKVANTTDAFWFRIFGTVEYGQVTIIVEEFDRMDENSQIMAVLKEGYQPDTRVPRMNSNNDKMEFFNPFGFKIIIAEKSPNENKARGVLDRSFKIKSYKGIPDYNIKEITNPQGNTRRQELFDELMDLRKLLFMYRLIHIKDPYKEIDIGLDGRDEELCKPLLQLFYTLGASEETLNELVGTLQYFLDIKNKRKGQTLEAIIYPIILNAVSQQGETISSTELWQLIIESLDGQLDEKNSNKFHSSVYGKIYRNTITNMICDKFGAEPEHTREGYILRFNPDHLRKIAKIYASDTQIKIKAQECEHVNTVNTVNKEVCDNELGNSNYNLDYNHDESANQSEKDISPSVHGINGVNMFTNKAKCPYCVYEEDPFFLKIHIKTAHIGRL